MTEDKRGNLSTREQQLLSRVAEKNKSIITLDVIRETIDVSYDTAREIASKLVRKHWLDRLEPGKYLVLPLSAGEDGVYTENEFIIANSLVDKGYVSYWSALHYHGLTEQLPATVFVATPKQKASKAIHGVEYKFVNITERKYFGFASYPVDTGQARIATPEKALVDCADHPKHCEGIREVAKALRRARNDLDFEQLTEFLDRQGNGTAVKRIVYLADLFNISLVNRRRLEDLFTSGYSKLDPSVNQDGSYNARYKLRLNISDSDLLTES